MFDRSFDGASFDAHDGPMRCCCAVPRSSDCQTVADTRRVVGSCWLCGAHRARAAAVACENRGNPDRGTPSSANPHNQPMPCMRSVRSTQSAAFMVLRWTRAQWQGMSAGIWSLRQAATLRARILTWAACRRHCRSTARTADRINSLLARADATVWIATSFRPHPCVFVHTLACQCS